MKYNSMMAIYNIGLLQGKAYRVMQKQLTDALAPFSLSIPEWKLLGQLNDHKELRVADLAQIMDVDPPLITALVSSLERKNFVKKMSHKSDRRAVCIVATTKGKKTLGDTIPVVRQEMAQLFLGITAEERGIYMKVLGIIAEQGKSTKVKKNYLIE